MRGIANKAGLGARALGIFTGKSSIVFATTIASLSIRIVSSIVLTRLLSPEVYGIAAIIVSIAATMALLSDLGFHAFVIRHPAGDDPHFLNVIWTIHVLRGLVLATVAAAVGPACAYFLQKPEIALPLVVICLQFALGGLSSLGPIVILRSNALAKLCLIEVSLLVFQSIVSIAAAFFLHNIWSLMAGLAAHSALQLILSYLAFPKIRHKFSFDKVIFREFWSFSKIVLVSSALTLIISQSDKIFLARLLTLEEFGLYILAVNLAMAAQAFAESYVNRVLYPKYARIWLEQKDSYYEEFYRPKRMVSIAFAFGAALLLSMAPVPITILYDERYEGASVYLSIIMIAAIFSLSNKAASSFLVAASHLTSNTKGNFVRLAWLCFAVPSFLHLFGHYGVVLAFGLIEIPTMLYFWLILVRLGAFNPREESLQVFAILAGLASGAILNHPTLFLIRFLFH